MFSVSGFSFEVSSTCGSIGDKSQLVSTLHVDNFPVVKNHSYSTAGSYNMTMNASNSVGLSTVQLVVRVYGMFAINSCVCVCVCPLFLSCLSVCLFVSQCVCLLFLSCLSVYMFV